MDVVHEMVTVTGCNTPQRAELVVGTILAQCMTTGQNVTCIGMTLSYDMRRVYKCHISTIVILGQSRMDINAWDTTEMYVLYLLV